MANIAQALTEEEREFLLHHDVPLDKVFDVYGLPKWLYQDLMREEGALIACRATPCARAGHSLRTRAGHCVQCDTSKIAYMRRWELPGFIYVGWSERGQLCKVGFSTDPEARIETLNSVAYAGLSDWVLAHDIHVDNGGRIEHLVHQSLSPHQALAYYIRSGITVQCYEVYSCDLEAAIDACYAIYGAA